MKRIIVAFPALLLFSANSQSQEVHFGEMLQSCLRSAESTVSECAGVAASLSQSLSFGVLHGERRPTDGMQTRDTVFDCTGVGDSQICDIYDCSEDHVQKVSICTLVESGVEWPW